MRRLKAARLGVLAVVVLMTATVSAQATPLTSPAGTFISEGAELKAEAESTFTIEGTINIKCQKSILEGAVAAAGGASTTANIPLSKFTLEECGANTATVLKPGTLELHATEGGNGTATWSGAEITVLTHNILGTLHCIYTLEGTDIGTLTGSKTTGATATLDIGTVPLVQKSTDSGCGSTQNLTGSYKVTGPDYLDVDNS